MRRYKKNSDDVKIMYFLIKDDIQNNMQNNSKHFFEKSIWNEYLMINI